MVGTVKVEARIKELVENFPDLAVLVEPMLIVRRVLHEQTVILHRRLLAIVRDDEVCRRLMTVPGVGPVVPLTYRATVDVPRRAFVGPSQSGQFLDNASVNATPLPAALPLFATGLGALGLLGWRRKRKALAT
jgi:hypothetical protein